MIVTEAICGVCVCVCVAGGAAAAGQTPAGRADESERAAAAAGTQQHQRHGTDVPGESGQPRHMCFRPMQQFWIDMQNVHILS